MDGPSPRRRGLRRNPTPRPGSSGSIPASAGSPFEIIYWSSRWPVLPSVSPVSRCGCPFAPLPSHAGIALVSSSSSFIWMSSSNRLRASAPVCTWASMPGGVPAATGRPRENSDSMLRWALVLFLLLPVDRVVLRRCVGAAGPVRLLPEGVQLPLGADLVDHRAVFHSLLVFWFSMGARGRAPPCHCCCRSYPALLSQTFGGGIGPSWSPAILSACRQSLFP